MGSDFDRDLAVDDLAARGPGEDRADPYDDVDVAELPDWWREAIEEFREHGLRPFRPPRFSDGVPKHAVVSELERELGVEIRFRGTNVTHGDDWQVEVDGEPVGLVGRHRSAAGYTVYELTAAEFERFVREKHE